jgi:hypothetical protein
MLAGIGMTRITLLLALGGAASGCSIIDAISGDDDSGGDAVCLDELDKCYFAPDSYEVSLTPRFVEIGRFNDDGDQLDIAAIAEDGGVTFMIQDEEDDPGQFVDVPGFQFSTPGVRDAARFDLNGDGVDELVASTSTGRVEVINMVGIQFGVAVGDPGLLAAADYDRDGFDDVAVINHDTDQVVVLFGQSSGAFDTTTATLDIGFPMAGIAAADVDGVSGKDITVITQLPDGKLQTFLNDGNAGFTAQAPIDPCGVSDCPVDPGREHLLRLFAGNLDDDGRDDFIVHVVCEGCDDDYERLRFVTASSISNMQSHDRIDVDFAAVAFGVGHLDSDTTDDFVWQDGRNQGQLTFAQFDGIAEPGVPNTAALDLDTPSFDIAIGDVNADANGDLVLANDLFVDVILTAEQ